jgi:hypothetical protein
VLKIQQKDLQLHPGIAIDHILAVNDLCHHQEQINHLPVLSLREVSRTDQLIHHLPDPTELQNKLHLHAQVIHLRSVVQKNLEVMKGQAIHLPKGKGIMMSHVASISQAILLLKGAMMRLEITTDLVIRLPHHPGTVHLPEEAAVTDLPEEAVVAPAVHLLLREEEGNKFSNDISFDKKAAEWSHPFCCP